MKINSTQIQLDDIKLKAEKRIVNTFNENVELFIADIDILESQLDRVLLETLAINEDVKDFYKNSRDTIVPSAKKQCTIYSTILRGIMILIEFKKKYGEYNWTFPVLTEGTRLYNKKKEVQRLCYKAVVDGQELTSYEHCIIRASQLENRLKSIQDRFINAYNNTFRLLYNDSDSFVKFAINTSGYADLSPLSITSNEERVKATHNLKLFSGIYAGLLFPDAAKNETKIEFKHGTFGNILFKLSNQSDRVIEAFELMRDFAYELNTTNVPDLYIPLQMVSDLTESYQLQINQLNEKYADDELMFELIVKTEISPISGPIADTCVKRLKINFKVVKRD